MLAIAEAALAVLAEGATAEFERVHGRIADNELVIMGYGRLGGGLLTHASDLDLVFLFTGEHGAESDGARPLGGTLYFNRLSQRVIAALSVPTAEGALYEVDTRLRPSGAQGPIAVSLDSFERYQHEAAWTWEHMALTRARPIAGRYVLELEDGAYEGRHALEVIATDSLGSRTVTKRAFFVDSTEVRQFEVRQVGGQWVGGLEHRVHQTAELGAGRQFAHRRGDVGSGGRGDQRGRVGVVDGAQEVVGRAVFVRVLLCGVGDGSVDFTFGVYAIAVIIRVDEVGQAVFV